MAIRSARVLVLALAGAISVIGGTIPTPPNEATAQAPTAVAGADAHLEVVRNGPANELTAFDGKLYFTAGVPSRGHEVVRSDGTRRGTSLLKDVRPGRHSSFPAGLTATRKYLFFFASQKSGPNGLWRTDLWRTDGTRSGTVVVERDFSIDPGRIRPVAVGKLLYFIASDAGRGRQMALWRSDGTARGTFPVKKNVRPGWDYESSSDDVEPEMVGAGGRLFFSADGDQHGFELWTTNGTARGTRMVKDVRPGRPDLGSQPRSLTAVGRTLYFSAKDGTHGRELWRSDGTRAGTRMVADVTSDDHEGPQELTAVGATLYFVDHAKLWRSDGTATGTTQIAEVWPSNLTAAGDTLFFASSLLSREEIWSSDGTAEGTAELTDLRQRCVAPGKCRSAYKLRAVGGKAYFRALATSPDEHENVNELWTSDGTASGTGPITELSTVPSHNDTSGELVAAAGTVFLTVFDGAISRLTKIVPGPPVAPTCHGLPATVTGAGQIVGTPRSDVIVGSSGDDVIDGGAGDDIICGGSGEDTVAQGSAVDGADSVDGQDGTDTVDYAARSAALWVRLSEGLQTPSGGKSSDGDAITSVENVVGGSGDDILTGSGRANRLVGGDGNDTFVGTFGDDIEMGGPGEDTFLPDWRTDGGDVLDGGVGNDSLYLGNRSISVSITIDAGDGDDGYADEGDTVLDVEAVAGTEGDDVIIGGPDDERLTGDHGDDLLVGGGGADILLAGFGSDQLDLSDGVTANDEGDGGPDTDTDTATFDPGDILIGMP